MKVSLDGELYVVEMASTKSTTKVQINSKTKEIREYEFQKIEEEVNLFSNLKAYSSLRLLALAFLQCIYWELSKSELMKC